MKVDERIVIKMPKYISKGTNHRKAVWANAACRRALWVARNRIIDEQGLDIFNVFIMTDCIEVTVRGELEAKPSTTKIPKGKPGRPRKG